MKTNYHTHNQLCGHANGNVEDYVLKAIECGYDEIGISDHGPIPTPIFPRMTYEQFQDVYLKEINYCKNKYGDKIKIYAGVEIEYTDAGIDYYKTLLEELDYLILAVHYYTKTNIQQNETAGHCDTHSKLDSYVDVACEAMRTGLFKILAHPDIFMLGYITFDDYANKKSKELIQCAMENDVILEINANGIRGCKNRIGKYPTVEFFKLAKSMGAKIMVNSDCHDPSCLDDDAVREAHSIASDLEIDIIKSIF